MISSYSARVTVLDEMTPAAVKVVFDALDHAMENAAEDERGFHPFAILVTHDGKRSMTRFVSGDPTDGVDAGRAALADSPDGTAAVALAWDGYLTVDGERTEAVFVESYEVGLTRSVLVAQRYERVDGALSALGDPVLHDETEPMVRGPILEPESPYTAMYFAGSATLADAAKAFSERGLEVTDPGDGWLRVSWFKDGPCLRVRLNTGPYVGRRATVIAEAAEQPGMADLDRRFEIHIDDLDDALDEINTLIEVQVTLQELTGGYMWNSWNEEVQPPED